MHKVLVTDRSTRDMAADAIKWISLDNDPPFLFARGMDNLAIDQGGQRIQAMDTALCTYLAEEHCDWYRQVDKKGLLPTRMPPHVAEHMTSHAPWTDDLPVLKRLVRSPVILPDGRILSQTGYDADSGLYLALEPGFVLPPSPDEPTEDDMQRGAGYIRSWLDEFVFSTLADAANALGLFIAHHARPIIGEDALLPMFCLDAPIQSTGKTALGNGAGVFALGSPPKIVPEIKDADEMRKQVAALLKGENELVLFDNLTEPLDDASLAAMLTGEGVWGGRLLGGNELVNERTKLTVIVTGNNLEVGPDLRRRSVYIRMDTNLADPSSRSFRRADFLGMLKQARPRLLSSFFTWARYWLQHGSPVQGAPILAGYNPFVRTVHGLLRLVGIDHWLGNLASFRANQDIDSAAWERWLGEWYRIWGSDPQTTGDLAKALNSHAQEHSAFSDLRPQELQTYSDIDRHKLATSLGFALKKRQDVVFGSFKLILGTIRDGNRRWRVIPLDRIESEPPPPPPVEEPTEAVPVVPEVPSADVPRATLRKNEGRPSRATVEETGTSGPTGTEKQGGDCAPARTRTREFCRWTPSAFSRACAPEKSLLATDTETTGLSWWGADRGRVVTLATEKLVIWADIWAEPEALEDLAAAWRACSVPVAMHNAVFDLGILARERDDLAPQIFDTMLASQLRDQGGEDRPPQGLDDLALRYLGITLDKQYQKADWAGPLSDEMIEYACLDAGSTWDLADFLRARVAEEGLEQALEIEHGFVPFLIALHKSGLPVDQTAWVGLEQHAIENRLRLEQRLAELYPGTPPERWTAKGWLEGYLSERGLAREFTSAGKPSLSKKALEHLSGDELVQTYLAWKPHEKRGANWGTRFLRDNLAEDGRFHGSYRQLGTRTGRLSCDKPNLQNIPRGPYREALRPGEGRCFIKADYSQLQLVIIADETLDPIMLAAYDPAVPRNQRPDLHTVTARNVLGLFVPEGERIKGAQRIVCKNINFGLCYGMGIGKLAAMIERETGQPIDEDEARLRKAKYFQTYSGVRHWHNLAKHKSARGMSYDDEEYPNPIDVRSPSGRRRAGVWEFGQKVNSPIQMREADGVKCGLALLLPRLARFNDARVAMMIHDEVIVECDQAEAEEVAAVVATSLEEGMNRWLVHTTATVEVDIVRDYAGTPL